MENISVIYSTAAEYDKKAEAADFCFQQIYFFCQVLKEKQLNKIPAIKEVFAFGSNDKIADFIRIAIGKPKCIAPTRLGLLESKVFAEVFDLFFNPK